MDYSLVQKPQRYIGNEWNVIKKSHADKIKICLSYPDLYEIGMSNLGLRIIYGLLNSFSDVVCERVFMPGKDYEEFIKSKNQLLASLETKVALNNFEVIGFNFNYELNYTNFLHILNLGGIPLDKKERQDTIVLASGMANPEPVADFVDVFFLGEFEDMALAFIEVLRKYKDRKSRLEALSQLDGFYVPEFYNNYRQDHKYIFEKKYPFAKDKIKRVYVKNLDNSYYPVNWLTSYSQIVHDRVPLEIARGCPNRCTFCQARALYYPYRQRSVDRIEYLLKEIYKNSGYETFSLLSLSSGNYSQIEELIDRVLPYCQDNKIGIALPSLRIDDIVGRLYQKLIPLKKISLTLAVEAASDDLRNRLNKNIDIRKLLEAASILKALKIRSMKVYFMFGFPQESEEDLLAIGDFLEEVSRQTKLALNVSINIFIPKPLSLWQDQAMANEDSLEKKREIIFSNIPRRRSIEVSMSARKKSLLEAILSRGDRSLGKIIYKAYLRGALFMGDNQYFSWDIWENIMQEQNFDYRQFLEVNTDNFPWSFIEG